MKGVTMRLGIWRGAAVVLGLVGGLASSSWAGGFHHTIPRLTPAMDYRTGGQYYAPPIPYGHYTGVHPHVEAAAGLVHGLKGRLGGHLHGGAGFLPCGACGGGGAGGGCGACGGDGVVPCGPDGGIGHGGVVVEDGQGHGLGGLFGGKHGSGGGGLFGGHGGKGGAGHGPLGGHGGIHGTPQAIGSPQVVSSGQSSCGSGCGLGGHGGAGCGLLGGGLGHGGGGFGHGGGGFGHGGGDFGHGGGSGFGHGGNGHGGGAGFGHGQGACGACGGAGCGLCGKHKGLLGLPHHLLGALTHKGQVEYFVGPGGPVPITPGYVPYVVTTRSPRDYFAFPPYSPDLP